MLTNLLPWKSLRLIRTPACVALCIALVIALPASAGELAFGKAAPPAKPDSARNNHCISAYGEGYSDLGGTGTCVKFGGRVRVDVGGTSGSGQGGSHGVPAPFLPDKSLPDKSSRFGTATEAYAEVDTRTPVLGQTLRVFTRLHAGYGDEFLKSRAAHQ